MKTFKGCGLIFGLVLMACGPEDGDSGKVNLIFSDNTATSLAETTTDLTADIYKIRFFDIRLGTVESNGGSGDVITSIWVQKGCDPNAAKTEQEIDKKMYEVYNADACVESDSADWIDLTSTDAEINAIFNGATLPVPPAAYNYVGISTCKMLSPNESYQNYEFQGGEMTTTITGNNCQASWLKSPTPIVVGEGAEVNVAIKYDRSKLLRKTVAEAALSDSEGSCWLSDDKLTTICNNVGGYSINVDLLTLTGSEQVP